MATSENKSIRKLVAGCRDGSKDDWSELIHRLTPVIFSACYRFRLSREESFDVFGKVSLLLLEHIETLRDEERIYGYVATIANREATALKARARLVRDKLGRLMPTEPLDNSPSPLPEMMLGDDIEILARAFTALPGKCRELLRLLFWDSDTMSYQEISRRLGIPVSSIGPTRGRCLEKLRKKMKEYGFEE